MAEQWVNRTPFDVRWGRVVGGPLDGLARASMDVTQGFTVQESEEDRPVRYAWHDLPEAETMVNDHDLEVTVEGTWEAE